jgi:hypothetical protein
MTDDVYTPGPPERVSDDDPIVHGNRWRRERDEAIQALMELRAAVSPYLGLAVPLRGGEEEFNEAEYAVTVALDQSRAALPRKLVGSDREET